MANARCYRREQMHKYSVGQTVTVQRWKQLSVAKIIRLGEESNMPVYDTDDGHWCYEDQIVAAGPETATITLTKEQAEKIQDYLRDYVGVIDGLLYDRYGTYEERMALQDDIYRHMALLGEE